MGSSLEVFFTLSLILVCFQHFKQLLLSEAEAFDI